MSDDVTEDELLGGDIRQLLAAGVIRSSTGDAQGQPRGQTWMLVHGIELRRTGKTLDPSAREKVAA